MSTLRQEILIRSHSICLYRDLCKMPFLYAWSFDLEINYPKMLLCKMSVDQGSWPGCVAQSVGHLTRKSGVLGSIPGLATYFRFSLRFFKKGSCQLLAKVCA